MKSGEKPFPNIARFPREPKLDGVPHLRSESLFSLPGIIEALELTNDTFEANSAQRRPLIDRAIGRIGLKPQEQDLMLVGLRTLANESILENEAKKLNASFLLDSISDRLESINSDAPDYEEVLISDKTHGYDGEWAMRITGLNPEKSERKRRLEKDPAVRGMVAPLIANINCSDAAIVEAGVTLFKRFDQPDASTEDSVKTFVELAMAIDKVKKDITGFKGKTDISNLIIAAAGSTLAAGLPLNNEVYDLLQNIIETTKTNNGGSFMLPKWMTIERQYRDRWSIQLFASKLVKLEKYFGKVIDLGGTELAKESKEAMQQLYMFRRYGLKPAYFRDGLLHERDESWVIRDPNDEVFTSYAPRDNPNIADILLVGNKKIDNIQRQIQLKDFGTGDLVVEAIPYDVRFMLEMMPDGELIVAQSRGAIPVKREFMAQGAEQSYELLKYTNIMRVMDLLIPATLIDGMPKIKPNPGIIGRLKNTAKLSNIQELLVPRIRLLKNQPELIENHFREETEQADERIRRLLRKHEVVGHIRALPDGYCPSLEARELAERLGINLAKNETWVKRHARGSEEVGIITSHEAIRRLS